MENFKPTDTIIAAISVNNSSAAPANASVGARWTGPDGKVFNEEAQAKDYAPGTQPVVFRVANPAGFASGRYKLEVTMNGSVVQMREFSVQ